VQIEIVEWPGGEPKQIDLDVTPKVIAAVSKGRMTVPLNKQVDLAEVAGLPWCSIATLHSACEKLHGIIAPAIRQPDQCRSSPRTPMIWAGARRRLQGCGQI
jgi:hypothetical protein